MGLRRLTRELKEAEGWEDVLERKIAAIVSYLHRSAPGMPDPREDDDPDPEAPPTKRPGRAT